MKALCPQIKFEDAITVRNSAECIAEVAKEEQSCF